MYTGGRQLFGGLLGRTTLFSTSMVVLFILCVLLGLLLFLFGRRCGRRGLLLFLLQLLQPGQFLFHFYWHGEGEGFFTCRHYSLFCYWLLLLSFCGNTTQLLHVLVLYFTCAFSLDQFELLLSRH
jgi:hypothetical protein